MAYQAILRVYKGFSGGGWPRAWRGVRVADMGGRTTPPRSPYKPSQVPHSAQGRLKSQKAAFPLGEEVRISRLGLKPAPRSEKADIGCQKFAALGTPYPGLFLSEPLVSNKKRPRRFFRGPGLRRGTTGLQIDRGSGREVFASTSQRNAVL